MQKRIARRDEQIKLIMECRQSGLSDYQWCQRQDINVGTFYNWVSKLRKAGYTIPDSKSKSEGAVVVQDVVNMNVIWCQVLFAAYTANIHILRWQRDMENRNTIQ